jgi:hypothetical protein
MKAATQRRVTNRQWGALGGRQVRTTIGELVVAAFDVAGSYVPSVARLIQSPEFGRTIHYRIVLDQ